MSFGAPPTFYYELIMNKLKIFLETAFQNNRSSARTDRLHTALLDLLINYDKKYTKYKWVFEYTLDPDGFKGTFKIDIAGFDKKGNLRVAVLAKCINQNMAQNIKNYAAITISETCRILDAKNPLVKIVDEILFITIFPSHVPYFCEDGMVKRFENILVTREKTDVTEVLNRVGKGLVRKMDITYDITDLREKRDRRHFMNIIPTNIRIL